MASDCSEQQIFQVVGLIGPRSLFVMKFLRILRSTCFTLGILLFHVLAQSVSVTCLVIVPRRFSLLTSFDFEQFRQFPLHSLIYF